MFFLVLPFMHIPEALSTTSCFSQFQPLSMRTMQALCCYPVTEGCFTAEHSPEVCCPFALSSDRFCTRGCNASELQPLSFDSAVRLPRHYPTLDLYLKLVNDENANGSCVYQEVQTLFYGYMKAGNELPVAAADVLEVKGLARLWTSLRKCDLSDDEMWSLSHMTRPLMSYLIRYKNHFVRSPGVDSPVAAFTRNVIPEGATAWDVGASDGEDTLYLLSTSPGFSRVLAVEASPPTVQFLRQRIDRFGWRATVVDKAVLGGETSEDAIGKKSVTFSYYPQHSQVSRLSDEGPSTGAVRYRVGTTSCGSLARVYGVPWLVKIDIEDTEIGEQPCLADLCKGGFLPEYLTLEIKSVEHIRQLVNCGYKKFKFVSQSLYALYLAHEGAKHIHKVFNQPVTGGTNQTLYQFTSSGPLGEDAVDWISGHEWRTAEEVAMDINLTNAAESLPASNVIKQVIFGTKGFGAEWFDVHARLSA